MTKQNGKFSYRMGSWVIRHRIPILVLILLSTGFFAYQASKVDLRSPTIDLFPRTHEFVKTYVEYEDTFGGANVVLLALTVDEGDIYNAETLNKIKELTKQLELLPAVNNYQILSIAQRKIKRSSVVNNQYTADPVMWPSVPQTQEEIDHLRHVIYTTGRLRGTLTSTDDQGALIIAGFFERGLQSPKDPLRTVLKNMVEGEEEQKAATTAFEKIAADQVWSLDDTLYDALGKIIASVEDDNHDIQIIGRPVLLGFIQSRMDQVLKIFLLTVGTIVFFLALFYRDVKGVLVPVLTALISACWGIGILGLLGHHFNPLVIVVPFIISARALSHSVQLIERFMGEYNHLKDRKEAAVATFSGLFKPGMLSIVTDAAGVFIVMLVPIPLMEKLALMGGFWVMSIIVSDILFNPILLSLLPAPRHAEVTEKGFLYNRLKALGAWTTGKHRGVIAVVTLVVFAIAAYFWGGLVVGDVHPGTPMLWPDSPYNQDTDKIGRRFGNTETLSIVVQGAIEKTFTPVVADVAQKPALVAALAQKLGVDYDGEKTVTIEGAGAIDAMEKTLGEPFGFSDLVYLAPPATTDELSPPALQEFETLTSPMPYTADGVRFGFSVDKVVMKNAIKAPVVLRTMEALQRELEEMPEVASTSSIAGLVPSITRIFAGGFPKWELIPADSQQAGLYLEIIFSGAEPGDLARFVTNDLKDANISVYLRDHKGETLRKVVAKARAFIAAHPMLAIGGEEGGVPGMVLAEGETKEVARLRLAGNYGGLLAAVNETIQDNLTLVTVLAFSLVFVFCSLTFRSLLAGVLFLIPIAISNYLTYALMGAIGIGLDVNSLPVVSLGVGLGVDYGVYVIGRIEEEFKRSGDLSLSIATAVATAGQAVVKEATTMVAGIIFWAWSFLRFQAEMGILLAFWMIVSMLGGLIILPTLISIIKPKFITKQYKAA